MGGLGGSLALAARLVLAVALLWAASAKVKAGSALPAQVRAFGVPRVLARPVAVLLPVAEAGVGVALVVCARSSWPGWVAVGLLGAFTVLVLATLPRGVPCPCFGAPGSSGVPTGARTVVRNIVLLAIAVLATGDVDGARAPTVVVLVAALAFPVVTAIVRAEGGHG